MTSDLLLPSAGDEFGRSPRYELFVRGLLCVNDKFPGKAPIEALLQLYPSLSVAGTVFNVN
jgi:hypothetical protein